MKTIESKGQELNDQQGNQEFASANSMDMNNMFNDFNVKSPIVSQNNSVVKNQELEVPVKKETNGIATYEGNNDAIDHFYQTNIDKQWTGLEKLTNRTMYKQVQEVKQNLFKESAHYRLAFYKTMLDTRLEYLNEHCNSVLKMVKGHYRLQASNFLMGKMEELSFLVRDKQFAFLEMMKGKYAYSESLTGFPSMKQNYLSSIFREEENYLKFLDGLLDKFQNIVNEELRKYN